MKSEYLSIEDANKLVNYDKLLVENTMLKSDNSILRVKSKENDKKYLKIIEEKNKRIKELETEIYNFKNKQKNIFEVEE